MLPGDNSRDPLGGPRVKDELAQELARMALDLHQQPDVEQTAGRFLDYVSTALGTSHASVVLMQRGGRLEPVAATDALVQEADRLQLEIGEGPTHDTVNDQTSVLSPDATEDPRWPTWATKAATIGLRGILSVCLQTPTTTVGALTLYSQTPGRFAESDTPIAQLYADHATVAVTNARSEATLWQAIEARKQIGQAQGILMERFGLTGAQAFSVLRRYSQDHNIKLRAVAHRLIATRNLPENL
jgi:GAF domain-containing protein